MRDRCLIPRFFIRFLEAVSRVQSRSVTITCESRTSHVVAAKKFGICVVRLDEYRQQSDGKKAFPELPFFAIWNQHDDHGDWFILVISLRTFGK